MADYDASPLMKSGLEMLCHSIEHFVEESPRDRRLTVLHLAQTVELCVKAVLVEHNEPIYDQRNETRTLSGRQCLEALARVWDLDRVPFVARIELLTDERNAMQHRFGTVDELTVDYHMETAFRFIDELMTREYGADLNAFLRENLNEQTWRRCRFIKDEQLASLERAQSLVEGGTPIAGLLEAFVAVETAIIAASVRSTGRRPRSTLDVAMKFTQRLVETKRLVARDQAALAEMYRLRNAAVHAGEEPRPAAVKEAIRVAERVLRAVSDPSNEDLLNDAISNSLERVLALEPEGREAPSTAELLDRVARRQLDSPPPRFVGLAQLQRTTGARAVLDSMIDGDLLTVYHVPNPEQPDFPTAAVRVNLDCPEVVHLLAPTLLARLREQGTQTDD